MKEPSFKTVSAGFPFYHPIANVIISCIEKRGNFINRGLFEVRNLQAENFVSEKFAITTYSRLIEGFLKDFTILQKDVEVQITGSVATSLEKVKKYESQNIPKYRLLFCPMDNLTNFARGINECGCYFVLQSILPSTSKMSYETVFCLFYSFKIQKFLYAENKGLVYFENKRMKALQRKTSLLFGLNTRAIMENTIKIENFEKLRIKQIFSRESLISDAFDLTNGSIDGIFYKKIKLSDCIAIKNLATSLGCVVYDFEEELEKEENLNTEFSILIGSENLVKTLKTELIK